ncbi:MAG: multicopper oxidase family protein [Polyangiaceae bacterium]
MRRGLLIYVLACVVACGSSKSELAQPPLDPVALVPAKDENPDPAVLEVSLEAREATTSYGGAAPTPVWTYNGRVPGPLLDAKVGDRIIVKLTNSLPDSTSIHWHGVRLPATMDGTMAMQSPIPSGGTFRYEFTFKDAGLYWYHPHVRSDMQVHKGLYGAIRVHGPNEPTVDDERILILDDIKLRADGTINDYLDDMSRMMGREGNTLLVNGIPDATLNVRAGGTVRLRLVNAANGRFFNLRLSGHTWRVIGHDGGLLAKAYDTEHVLIAPGERYDVLVIPNGAPSTTIDLLDDPYDRGHDSGGRPTLTVAHVRLSDEAPLTGRVLPDAFPGVAALPGADATSVSIKLDEATRNGETVFTVNGQTYPDVPPVDVENGGLRILDVENASEMDHPFHLHGFFFQVVEKNGAPVVLDSMGNKDTIIIPAKGRLKLRTRFDEPGHWMYHCHILEHAELGMMGEVHVQ